jgi:hypothetical protein
MDVLTSARALYKGKERNDQESQTEDCHELAQTSSVSPSADSLPRHYRYFISPGHLTPKDATERSAGKEQSDGQPRRLKWTPEIGLNVQV